MAICFVEGDTSASPPTHIHLSLVRDVSESVLGNEFKTELYSNNGVQSSNIAVQESHDKFLKGENATHVSPFKTAHVWPHKMAEEVVHASAIFHVESPRASAGNGGAPSVLWAD
jgi:hypothetical protein